MSEPAFDPGSISYVEAMETVRDAHPKPMSRATGKVLGRLDQHCRTILQHATFCVIGTHGTVGAVGTVRADHAEGGVLQDGPAVLVEPAQHLAGRARHRLGMSVPHRLHRLDIADRAWIECRFAHALRLLFATRGSGRTVRPSATAAASCCRTGSQRTGGRDSCGPGTLSATCRLPQAPRWRR